MRLADLATRVLTLSKVIHAWLELLSGLEASRRQRISLYADEIAATLGRAADALLLSQDKINSNIGTRQAARELGRIAGYVEDIVGLLEDHLDGRKLRGVKRRLDSLSGTAARPPAGSRASPPAGSRASPLTCSRAGFRAGSGPRLDRALSLGVMRHRIDRLSEAEGYFRALADGLRV